MARILKTKNNISAKRPTEVDSGIGLGDSADDLWSKTRLACKIAIIKAFKKFVESNKSETVFQTPEMVGSQYEKSLYKLHNSNLNEYKDRFRKDLIAIRNFKTKFAYNLLSGELKVEDFTKLDELDLISTNQKSENEKLIEKELKSKLGTNFPDNINQIKNQNVFVGEKWGITESAAKIDPEFEND